MPPGVPPMLSASRRAAWLATGIQDGLGSPLPWVEVSFRRPSQLRRSRTVIELSSDCITSRMMVRSDQRLGTTVCKITRGCRAATASHCRIRLPGLPPSVSAVLSRPIALLPLP